MTWTAPLDALPPDAAGTAGGKGAALARLKNGGLNIPETICVTTSAYDHFLAIGGLREKIQLELNRKVFSEMRWEEIWDTAQRIRLLFLRHPMPPDMAGEIGDAVTDAFGDRPVVVRSSAPDEDRGGQSFAGLHASFTHLTGVDDTLRHIRLVWASLWSDAALLYRRELGLDTTSAMAVLIQEMVPGQASGILFTQDPTQAGRGVIEAVHGMNPPLVDGLIAPDRWHIDVDSGTVIDHTPPDLRGQWQAPASDDAHAALAPLPAPLAAQPPLSASQVAELWRTGAAVAALNGGPQDIEWTFRDGALVLLQARPVTTTASAGNGDQRAWYLSLHRSLDNLLVLQARIETQWIPGMQAAARALSQVPLDGLDDAALADEIRRRWKINQHWVAVYWEDFIPFAHGMRLFGEVYNQVMAPEDPYAFMELLKGQDLLSIQRNRSLGDLARGLRDRPDRLAALSSGDLGALDDDYRRRIEDFVDRYGDLSCPVTGATGCAPDAGALVNMLVQWADLPAAAAADRTVDTEGMAAAFFDACPAGAADFCRQLLPLARSSYRLRDDDNIILGAIEAQLIAAVQEGRRRAAAGSRAVAGVLSDLSLDAGETPPVGAMDTLPPMVADRQITGQPAGPGIARGTARVIGGHADIARFKRGEIIVCDAVDPNMTFVMPLAAGIVERRGGMLIHGAIIAREYGLPCVTGVADATTRIRTGQTVTVDGYLGIVTIGETGRR